MRIIPVIDLKSGVVVRGVAGRRAEYQPIRSQLTASCQPLDVARAFRQQFGLEELYVADLDAIAGEPPAWEVYSDLLADNFTLWLDAGVRDQLGAIAQARAGVQRIVVGLETLPGPDALPDMLGALGSGPIVFSLDLKNGVPLGDRAAWEDHDPLGIAAEVIGLGVRRLIVLDLAAVGMLEGVATLELCRSLHDRFPHMELITGGGVRDMEDVNRLEEAGASGVLVASALHDGRIKCIRDAHEASPRAE